MIKTLLLTVAAAFLGAAQPQLRTEFSSDQNDYNPSLDKSETLLVFARSKADFKEAHIYVSMNVGGRWTEPQQIEFSDARYSDSDPWLTPDGGTLYFVSNRPTAGEHPKADLDIWRSTRTATGWSAPEHLGAVNSPGPELGPELHGDVLTFASVRKDGKGGLDIYSARVEGDGFGAPAPIEGPFNSPESDSDFTLSADGRTAAFWRGGRAGASIYIAHRTEEGWTSPVELPSSINPGAFNFTPNFSSDGRSLWFASNPVRGGQEEGMADIFIASLPDNPK